MPDSKDVRDFEMKEQVRHERRALGWTAIGAVVVAAWVVRPVGTGILLGTLGAFVAQPVYERLKPRLGPSGASLLTVLSVALGLAGLATILSWMFITRGTALAVGLVDTLAPGEGTHRFAELIGKVTSRFGLTTASLETKLQAGAESVASRAAAIGAEVASVSASVMLAVFLSLLTMHFILRHWATVSLRAQASLPLRPEYTRTLIEEFRRVGRTTLLGTIVTGLAQGILATAGYALCGVPRPVFFGAATAVASLIPAVGTMLVWVPAGIILLLTHHPLGGVVELVWGGVVIVGVSDYVIRPRLVGGEGDTPSFVTFAALFGGVEAFGLKGLILGPLLVSLALAVLRLYAREAAERRRPTNVL